VDKSERAKVRRARLLVLIIIGLFVFGAFIAAVSSLSRN
jgi:hypothetical protein